MCGGVIMFRLRSTVNLMLVLTVLHGGNSQKLCRSATNKTGSCIPISDCPYLSNIRPKHLDRITKTFIHNSFCGKRNGDLMVCCENDVGSCTTYYNKPGACVRMKRCDPILRLLENTPFLDDRKITFLKKSICQSGSTKILKYCCPIFGHTIP